MICFLFTLKEFIASRRSQLSHWVIKLFHVVIWTGNTEGSVVCFMKGHKRVFYMFSDRSPDIVGGFTLMRSQG